MCSISQGTYATELGMGATDPCFRPTVRSGTGISSDLAFPVLAVQGLAQSPSAMQAPNSAILLPGLSSRQTPEFCFQEGFWVTWAVSN